jgi:CheY-like chemotaxis protein
MSQGAVGGRIGVRGTEILASDSRQQYREKLARITLDSMVQFVGLPDAAGTVDFAPDIAFLDLGLPVMDGYELASHLRALPGLADLHLIALTGYGQESDRRRTREAGFHHHLVKPVDIQAIEATLRMRLS